MYKRVLRFIVWGVLPLSLLLFGLYLTIQSLLNIPGFNILEYPYDKSNFMIWNEGELYKGDHVVAEFTSQANHLGIIGIRFHTFFRINEDFITFRIKEKGTDNWFAQVTHKSDQFQPDQYFPFGFPEIANSEGKQYVLEVSSENGKPGDAVAISTTNPPFATKHQYTKHLLQTDENQLQEFVIRKFKLLLEDKDIYFNALPNFLPLVLYFGLLVLIRNLPEIKIAYRRPTPKLTWLKSLVPVWDLDKFFLLDKNSRFPEFDGIRAWAIIMIIMVHVSPRLPEVGMINGAMHPFTVTVYKVLINLPVIGINGGGIGVDLFFVLSGFLIYMSITHNKQTFLSFIKRRMFRLLPAHLATMAPFAIGISLFGLVLNSFFLVDFFTQYQNANIVTWSLSYELLFYLILAIWLIVLKDKKYISSWKFFYLVIIVLYSSQWVVSPLLLDLHIKYLEMNRFLAFFFGVALAKIYFSHKQTWQSLEKFFSYGAILGIVIIVIFRYSWLPLVFEKRWGEIGMNGAYLVVDFGIFLLLASMLISSDHFLKRFFRWKPLRVIGSVSYSMYLNHLVLGIPLAAGVISFIDNIYLRLIVFVFACYISTFIVSIFLFHFLEKPYFLNRKKR